MKIISSQRYINEDILTEKIEMLTGEEELVLPVLDAHMQDEDGNDLYILFDGHHRFAAATELGIQINFDLGGEVLDWSGLEGERLLEACWMDSDYFDVMTGITVW